MSNIEFKKIVSKDLPMSPDWYEVLNLKDEYILTGSGILIDNKGNLLWNANLEHYFSRAVHVAEREIIITNRTIYFGMGGDRHHGIACIDMKTGKYKWKHFYDEGETRANLRNRKPDINMVRNIGFVDTIKECVYADGFEIDLNDGSYKYIGEVKREKNNSVSYTKGAKSLKERMDLYSENEESIKVNIDVINIEGQEFLKEGYFFNKCDFYIKLNDDIYFFGIPAKKNLSNAVLFQYSKLKKSIVEEIELPVRVTPYDVYDFFGKGMLFAMKDSIWLFRG